MKEKERGERVKEKGGDGEEEEKKRRGWRKGLP